MVGEERFTEGQAFDYGIDSHKLIYHIERVYKWWKGEDIYPIYIEAAPAGGCNQRCIFCGLDYTGHRPSFIDFRCWERFTQEAKEKGVKSILLSGEGEPLLNKDIDKFVESAYQNGLDVAIATNGVLFTSPLCEKCLPYLTWLRISLDAGSPDVYSLVHRVDKKEFNTVVHNVATAVKYKRANNYQVTIGIQFLLLKENYEDVEKATVLAKEIGVDYFSVKPYSKHPLSINNAGTEIDYSKWIGLEEKLVKYNSSLFKVIFRKNAMMRRLREKPYQRCLGLPFWAYINSYGEVYPCSTFLGLKEYCMGNIHQESFSQIWEGEKRKRIMKRIAEMDARKCRELCRLDEINAYLWRLKNPPPHVNFI